MKKISRRIVLIVIVSQFFLLGCATNVTRSLLVQSDYEEVFSACENAAIEARFGIVSSSSEAGTINAQQGVVGSGGSNVILNIRVDDTSSGIVVKASIVPPPGTVGDTSKIMENFVDALRDNLPGVAFKVDVD